MLKRLFGRFVLVVVVVLGLWFVISHYHGNSQFGCQIHLVADSGKEEQCPATIAQAAGNAEWAADRISTIAGDPITTGLLYDQDGHEEKIGSGEGGTAYEQAMKYLSDYSAVLGDQPRGKQAAGHVEPKAAAMMRTAGQTDGVLLINNPSGPCPYASRIGCGRAMRLILPVGSTIVVWWPGGQHGSFEGIARR